MKMQFRGRGAAIVAVAVASLAWAAEAVAVELQSAQKLLASPNTVSTSSATKVSMYHSSIGYYSVSCYVCNKALITTRGSLYSSSAPARVNLDIYDGTFVGPNYVFGFNSANDHRVVGWTSLFTYSSCATRTFYVRWASVDGSQLTSDSNDEFTLSCTAY
jgi:hypothetical protein